MEDRDDAIICVAKSEGTLLLLRQIVLKAQICLLMVVDSGLIPNPEVPDRMMQCMRLDNELLNCSHYRRYSLLLS